MRRIDQGQIADLNQNGQVTIPQKLREKHGIEPGSRARIRENEQGKVIIEPLPSLKDFRGAATTSGRGTSILRKERTVDEKGRQRLKRDN